MATKGGSGTFLPAPGDENVAPVIPLRQRQTEPSKPSTPRTPLPRERAAFDPELEPADVALRRRRAPRAALGRIRQATARLRVRPRLTATAAALAAMAAAGVLAAGILGPQPFTSAGARHATAQGVHTQMTEANADRIRYLFTRTTPATHAAPLTHHRGRTSARTKRAVIAARHRSHRNGASTAPPRTAHSGAVVHGQPVVLSGAQSSPVSSSGSSAGSDSGSTGSTSASNGSTARPSATLPPGPTGVGSANGCNPKCS
jgi:hypothetical protein